MTDFDALLDALVRRYIYGGPTSAASTAAVDKGGGVTGEGHAAARPRRLPAGWAIVRSELAAMGA